MGRINETIVESEGFIDVKKRLLDHGIINFNHKFTTRDLSYLIDLIDDKEKNWNLFYGTWNQNKYRYGLNYILILFKRSLYE